MTTKPISAKQANELSNSDKELSYEDVLVAVYGNIASRALLHRTWCTLLLPDKFYYQIKDELILQGYNVDDTTYSEHAPESYMCIEWDEVT